MESELKKVIIMYGNSYWKFELLLTDFPRMLVILFRDMDWDYISMIHWKLTKSSWHILFLWVNPVIGLENLSLEIGANLTH